MDVTFGDPDLDDLELNPRAKTRLDERIVKAYRRVMNYVRSMQDERELHAWPGLNCERLRGARAHQHSVRLNDKWRLIFEIRKAKQKNTFHVVSIEDYHK